ncbi:unnamed protein product [Brachionus calyciflorus]|uniref:Uncharacterized protein n=1 Tax=Brachionus calyciflorus TaxID=104777 RepID=A0A814CLI3_9BILA|nr:unnamed protein product [Brachionus calyciflorus]
MMNILNQNGSNLREHPLRLRNFPEKYALYGEELCFIEIENFYELNLSINDYNNIMDNVDYSTYTGCLFSKSHKKQIEFRISDFYANEKRNVILLSGLIPSNEIEETCYLFLFKNSICHIKHEAINNNKNKKPTQTEEKTCSILIGYCDIKYYKNNYIYLSEYLFHSVYDTKSLSSEPGRYFSPFEYLLNLPETPPDPVFLDYSPFRNFYLNLIKNKHESLKCQINLDLNLVKSYQFISIPIDWSLFAYNLNKSK